MSEGDARSRRTLEVAERVVAFLEAEGARAAVIGAVALAAHGYPRATDDLDVATAVEPFSTLARVADVCRRAGFEAKLIPPDAQDPLGGVLTVTGPDFEPIQVVNYYNPLSPAPNPGPEAIEHAIPRLEGSSLPVVGLPHLVALKLYAGGLKSKADVLAVLEANPGCDRKELRAACSRHGLLEDLEEVLRELP